MKRINKIYYKASLHRAIQNNQLILSTTKNYPLSESSRNLNTNTHNQVIPRNKNINLTLRFKISQNSAEMSNNIGM
jgi:hypothetical protein